jgi:hypothetical protein
MPELRKYISAMKKAGKSALTIEDWKKLSLAFANDSDRTIGIVLVTLVEDSLREFLIGNMRALTADDKNNFFMPDRLLGTFGAKINVAYAFKLIGVETYDDLNAIREIRNQFAHKPKVLSLSSAHVANVCNNFNCIHRNDSYMKSIGHEIPEQGPRQYFIRATGHMMFHLTGAHRSAQSREALLP